MSTTILNISVEIDSVSDIFFTSRPAIACVIAAIKASITPILISKSGLKIITVNIKPIINIKLLNFEVFSLKNIIPPKYINKGVLKLTAIACDSGIIVYEQKRRIIVIPPNRPRKKSNFTLLFFLITFFFLNTKGRIKRILNRFLKNDCSIGWTYCAPNFINVAKIEKSRQEDISKMIENIVILNYSVLQFINRYVNKNNELFFSN